MLYMMALVDRGDLEDRCSYQRFPCGRRTMTRDAYFGSRVMDGVSVKWAKRTKSGGKNNKVAGTLAPFFSEPASLKNSLLMKVV